MSNIVNLNVGLQGFYKIEATTPDGKTRTLVDWFPNVITDIGLNRWGTGGIINSCRIGTGTTSPTSLDTTLESVSATTSTLGGAITNSIQSSAPYYSTITVPFTFAQGAVVGNMSEVGVGWSTTGAALFSRARIKDSGGADTTITVNSIDQLTITYQLRLNIPSGDVVSTTTIAGVTTTVTLRAAEATSSSWAAHGNPMNGTLANAFGLGFTTVPLYPYSGAIGSVTGSPSGTYLGNSNMPVLNSAYSNNSYQQDIKWTFPTGNGNGTITSILITIYPGTWQIGFSPGVVKDNTKTFELILRFTWGRT